MEDPPTPMHDQPASTGEEQEQVLERQQEEEAMRYPGYDDPELPVEERPQDPPIPKP